MSIKYPLYIISKGRWDKRWTSRALEEVGEERSLLAPNASVLKA